MASEKKRFRLGDAVVNVNTMVPSMAEAVVEIASKAVKCVGAC